MSNFAITGRIVDLAGVAVVGATVCVHEIVTLAGPHPQKGNTALTDEHGRYAVSWDESALRTQTWDVFVRAQNGTDEVESALVSDLESTASVDLILGAGCYRGQTEWERIADRLAPLLQGVAVQDIRASRIEWLAKRADVFPTQLAMYVQAHRLATGRTIQPRSGYAFLRAGLPAALPELLRAGPAAWAAALRDGWARRVIPLPGDGSLAEREAEIERETDAMRALVIEAAMHRSDDTNHRQLFDAAGINLDSQRAFMQAWVAHEGPLSAFWDTVHSDRALGPQAAAEFQFAIQAAVLAGLDAPMLAALAAERASGRITSIVDLAAWDVDAWERLLTDNAIEPPPAAFGDRRRHARALERVIEDMHPTAYVRHALARERVPELEHVASILADNPSFDLERTTIAHHLAATPDALRSIAPDDQPLARRNLERAQRVFRLAPRLGRYATTKALLGHGIHAAADVVAFTRDEFVAAFNQLLPTDHHDPHALAGAIWDAAAQIHTNALALASQFGLAKSNGDALALQGIGGFTPTQANQGLDTLAQILGTLDYCACSACRSVLSPAAYLADLLGFLDDRPAKTESDALAVLRRRRPDIEHILLDCDNTNTELPAIDLVIELLERMLGGSLDGSSHQTTQTSHELRLHPEHADAALYAESPLTSLTFPWALPFSLPVLESRVYLRQLGVSRAELLALLREPTQLAVTAERLGMSEAEALIVAGHGEDDGRAAWGFAANADEWVATLAHDVPELLRRGGLELDELRELLSLTFVDPHTYGPEAGVELRWSETCSLADATIVNLDAATLDRLHRFTRLARRTGLPPRMLNVLVDDAGSGVLDDACMLALADMLALQQRLGRPWDELATWWSPVVDARTYADQPSLYQRRFLTPDAKAPAALRPTSPRGDAIVGAPSIGPDELPTVLAATQCSAGDCDRLLEAGHISEALSLPNLTRLFAITSLCRALRLSVVDFLALRELADTDPFTSPADTRRFIAQLDDIRSSSLSLAQLHALLLDEGPQIIDDATIHDTLVELARGMAKVDAEVTQLIDPIGDVGHERRRALLLDTAAAAFSISPAITEALLFEVLHVLDSDDPLADAYATTFATEEQIANAFDEHTHPAAFLGWRRLAKAAALTKSLGLAAHELAFYSGDLGGAWLDFDDLPLRADDPPASFDAWHRLYGATKLRSLGHLELATAETLADAIEVLAAHTTCPADELTVIVDALGWTTVAELADERNLDRLRQIAQASQRIGVRLDKLWSWTHDTPSLAQSAEIMAAARAKHDDQRWRDIAIPLRNEIRVAQRNALVAAVLATTPLTDLNALFDHLLIDTQVSPCMLTTRIHAAIASVQTFVQRIVLRLESDDVTLTPDAVRSWAWMKHFRVWEANRKVFLYPENWLAPELRPDKTPLFEALETKLLQDTLEPEHIERAVAGYLDGLERVAKLEIAAIADDFGELWLLGRTQNNPRQWFLRRRSKAKQWTAWEELPVQIDSDNVVLVAHAGRVQLFWLTLFEANVKTFVPVDDSSSNAHRFAISWMQRGEEGWSRVEVSARSGVVRRLWGAQARPYMLRSFVLDDEVRLIVYRRSLGNNVTPVAEFCYDVQARHVAYRGTDFDPALFADILTPQGNLERPSWIGIQPSYTFEGQRFVKVRFNETPGGDDGILDLAPNAELLPLPDAATSFAQGDRKAVLFRRATKSGYRSLLHAGDYWGLDPSKAWLPVVYDDRRHAYLLEPSPLPADADTPSPKLLGVVDLSGYFGCPPIVAPKTLGATPRLEHEDGLKQPKPWPKGVPGQVAGFVKLDAAFAPQVLGQAQQIMAGNVGVLAPSDAFAPEPGALSLRMQSLHHPHASTLVERVLAKGIDGVYRPSSSDPLFRQQLEPAIDPLSPAGLDLQDGILRGPAPRDRFDFEFGSPTGDYDWEVFFHVPMLIATKLGADRRWDQAQRWLHMIFDPIEVVDLPGETAATRCWRLRPFVEQAEAASQNQLLAMLGIGVTKAQQDAAIEAFERQVAVWRQHPFEPHAIARVRPGVYQRSVLMRYLDNLIDWADHLFRQDTRESINEAAQLYVLVSQLLGPRPAEVPGPERAAKSYHQLAVEGLDVLHNAAQQLENWVLSPPKPAKALGCGGKDKDAAFAEKLPTLRFWYFCHPPNPAMSKYWDIVEDRLWKIRHCRNIDGIERRLPLLAPPIDPGLLVRATAAGLDLSSVIGEFDSGLPRYRYRFVHARAANVCASLRSLGAALLEVTEKRDAEGLARVRSEHERTLLGAVTDVRRRQIDEITALLDGLRVVRASAEQRRDHYAELIDEGLSAGEAIGLNLALQAGLLRAVVQGAVATAGLFYFMPDITISVGTDASTKTTHGGSYIGAGLRAAAEYVGVVPTTLDSIGAWMSTQAAYDRRAQDWQLQLDQAELELSRIDADIVAAEIRLAIAERELANHELQVEQAAEVDAYLREKFSNRELYDWMLTQLSALYFQTYQLAFDLAKRAERAYRHELAVATDNAPIIRYGHWDGLREGLLAGERLGLELERLDLAYMDRHVREFELSKNVSLARLSPAQLHALQETGTCEFELPEALFDIDHPGHYLRRLRAVRVTIPAVAGPFVGVGARLELISHVTRQSPSLVGGYDEIVDDQRFHHGFGGGQAVATSTAVGDGGVFELDFADERYLPFEYAGAVSRWRLTLPGAVRLFDYRSISDVVMHLDYTARDGGAELRSAAELALISKLRGLTAGLELTLLLDVEAVFPNEWERFLAPEAEADAQVLTLPLDLNRFPHFAQRSGVQITRVDIVLLLEPPVVDAFEQAITLANPDMQREVLLEQPEGQAFLLGDTGMFEQAQSPGTWTLTRAKTQQIGELETAQGWLDRNKVSGMMVVVRYALEG